MQIQPQAFRFACLFARLLACPPAALGGGLGGPMVCERLLEALRGSVETLIGLACHERDDMLSPGIRHAAIYNFVTCS